MHIHTYRSWRRLAAWLQAAIIMGLPFISIRGESALRFDVPSLKLYFFGSVFWISEAYFFLLVLLLFLIGIMLVTVLFGRIWCGWSCPQTVLSDFTRLINRIFASGHVRTIFRGVLSQVGILLFSVLVSANLLWYFVSPYEMLNGIGARTLGPWVLGSWIFFFVLIYLDLAFVRHRFCSYVCPYARLQSAFFDDRTLTIAFDPARSKECKGCEACVKACPSHIDIRKGLQIECINCAQCIDACTARLSRSGKKSLIGYFGGSEAGRGPRPRVAGLSVLLALISVLFIYHVVERKPIDLFVMNESALTLGQSSPSGKIMNRYRLSVENRGLRPALYRIAVSGLDESVLVIDRNPFMVPANSSATVTVFIALRGNHNRKALSRFQFVLEDTDHPGIRVIREASFIIPNE